MKHVSIDLETLSTQPSAHILSIGAVAFNPNGIHLGKTFYRVIQAGSDSTGHQCPDTLKWWSEQGGEARKVFRDSRALRSGVALQEFANWIKSVTSGEPYPWGNGSLFDIAILEDSFRRHSIDVPWKHWAVRDVRTAVELGKVDKSTVEFRGVAHNALDDAIYQAQLVQRAHFNIKQGFAS